MSTDNSSADQQLIMKLRKHIKKLSHALACCQLNIEILRGEKDSSKCLQNQAIQLPLKINNTS